MHKEQWLSAMNYFKRQASIIENNLKRAQKELIERKRLAKERGLKWPIDIPEGYIDRSKDLREQIEISIKQLRECEETINDIHNSMLR